MALVPRGFRLYCNQKLERETIIIDETLTFIIDGTGYEITLKAGSYETLHEPFISELPDMITAVLQENSVPLLCRLGGIYDYENNRTVLVFEHTDVWQHHDVMITGGTGYDLLIGGIHSTDNHEDGIFEAERDLPSSILAVYPDLSDFESDISVRRSEHDETTAIIVVRRTEKSDLSSKLRIESSSILKGAIIVRGQGESTITGKIAIPENAEYDLGSFLIVKK